MRRAAGLSLFCLAAFGFLARPGRAQEAKAAEGQDEGAARRQELVKRAIVRVDEKFKTAKRLLGEIEIEDDLDRRKVLVRQMHTYLLYLRQSLEVAIRNRNNAERRRSRAERQLMKAREETAASAPGPGRAASGIDDGALKKALAQAAAMDPGLVEHVSGARVPALGGYPNQPLTFVLLASGYHGFPEDLRAHYPSAVPDLMIPAITKGGTVSILHEHLVTKLVYRKHPGKAGDRKERIGGAVDFEIPGRWTGSYGFLAEREEKEGEWRVVEFLLPESRRRIVLQEDGTWRVVMGLERAQQSLAHVSLQFDFYAQDNVPAGLFVRNESPGHARMPDRYSEARGGKAGLDQRRFPHLVGRLPGSFCEKDYFQVVRYAILGHKIEATVRHVAYRGPDRDQLAQKSVYVMGYLPALLPGRYSGLIEFLPWAYEGDKRKARPWKRGDAPRFIKPLRCEFEMPRAEGAD